MARSDWTELSDGLGATSVRRGVTAGVEPPSGGLQFSFGMRSVEAVSGAVGLFCMQSGFSPMDKGGRISGAVRRSSVGGPVGFAPYLFFAAQGEGAGALAYLLGLSDNNAPHIELRKGTIASGLPDAAVDADATPNVLMRSTDTYAPDQWHHLRLDVVVQGTGDVILQVYRNDLSQHPINAPVWTEIPGMQGPSMPALFGFVDDSLGVNTGTVPLRGGRAGFATRFEAANRATYFDHIAIDRQL